METQRDFTPLSILVTGGAGFIGSHVVVFLVKNYPQYRIVNLDKLDYCSSLRNLDDILHFPNYKFVKGNILSSDLVTLILKEEKIDTILHFAAQSHVDNSFGNSLSFTENNVLGTHVLLEAARAHGIRRFIHVSTDEVYGEAGNELASSVDHTESTLLQPTNPYAATKAGAELLVQAYHKSFSLPTIITRGNNVYGPGQFPEKIIPKFICLLTNGKPCFIHGKGNNMRSFIYVSDVVKAFDVILHKGHVGQIYNIGTNDEISNLQVAQEIIKALNLSDQDRIKFVDDRPFNDFRYSMKFDKLAALGWQVQVPWSEGLRKTVAWYLQNGRNTSEYWKTSLETVLVPHPRL